MNNFVLSPVTFEFQMLPMVARAMEFARAAHEGQTRNDNTPYFKHPQRVVVMLNMTAVACGYQSIDPELGAVAYLHDTMEDCGVEEEQISALFGIRVARGVAQLTNLIEGEQHKSIHGKPLWSEKHASLLAHCRVMHDDFKCIKIADRIDNLQDSKKIWKPKRLRRYARAGWEILEALNPPKDPITQLLVEDLRKVIDSIIPLDQIDTVKIEDDVQE